MDALLKIEGKTIAAVIIKDDLNKALQHKFLHLHGLIKDKEAETFWSNKIFEVNYTLRIETLLGKENWTIPVKGSDMMIEGPYGEHIKFSVVLAL